MRTRVCVTLLLCATVGAGCTPTLIPLSTAAPLSTATPPTVPLEVVTHSAAPDPLPLVGGGARYADVEVSLGHAVASAVVPWADAHRGDRPDGWQLRIELAQARAHFGDSVVDVALDVRATLRTRVGHVYLAQTQAHCHEHARIAADQAAPVFYGCMLTVAHELAGWLGGVSP
jgi:hypothetical protein